MDIDVIVERKSFDVELEIGNPVVEVKAPDHYNGPFDIFPSDEDQIIPVKEKMPVEDICVKGITGEETITQNGTYNTLEDKTVVVDVPQRFTLQTIADRSALQNLGEITIRLSRYPLDTNFGTQTPGALDLSPRLLTSVGLTSTIRSNAHALG